MALKFTRIIFTGVVFSILGASTTDVAAQQACSQSRTRQINFRQGQTSMILHGSLRPNNCRIYAVRAKTGQRMMVSLKSSNQDNGEAPDLVFWVQGIKYTKGRNTRILEGIDSRGVTDWSGTLPATGTYQVYLSNPPVSDHSITRTSYYTMQISIN
jgi:hypothetical protein